MERLAAWLHDLVLHHNFEHIMHPLPLKWVTRQGVPSTAWRRVRNAPSTNSHCTFRRTPATPARHVPWHGLIPGVCISRGVGDRSDFASEQTYMKACLGILHRASTALGTRLDASIIRRSQAEKDPVSGPRRVTKPNASLKSYEVLRGELDSPRHCVPRMHCSFTLPVAMPLGDIELFELFSGLSLHSSSKGDVRRLGQLPQPFCVPVLEKTTYLN